MDASVHRDSSSSDAWDSFYLDGRKVGVILRSWHAGGIETLSCFAVGEGRHFHVESTISLDDSLAGWTSYRYSDRGSGDTLVVVRADLPTDRREALPSYGEYLLVPDVAVRGTRSYARLLDGAPDQPAQDARLERAGTVNVTRPDGRTIRCIEVNLYVDGSRLNRFWVAVGELVKSDWKGAESFGEPSLEAALEGTDDYVRASVEHSGRW